MVSDDEKGVDGLHFISDYADKVAAGKTERWKFISDKNMMEICRYLGLTDSRRKIEQIGLT